LIKARYSGEKPFILSVQKLGATSKSGVVTVLQPVVENLYVGQVWNVLMWIM
jgi:hypothetical protein